MFQTNTDCHFFFQYRITEIPKRMSCRSQLLPISSSNPASCVEFLSCWQRPELGRSTCPVGLSEIQQWERNRWKYRLLLGVQFDRFQGNSDMVRRKGIFRLRVTLHYSTHAILLSNYMARYKTARGSKS